MTDSEKIIEKKRRKISEYRKEEEEEDEDEDRCKAPIKTRGRQTIKEDEDTMKEEDDEEEEDEDEDEDEEKKDVFGGKDPTEGSGNVAGSTITPGFRTPSAAGQGSRPGKSISSSPLAKELRFIVRKEIKRALEEKSTSVRKGYASETGTETMEKEVKNVFSKAQYSN